MRRALAVAALMPALASALALACGPSEGSVPLPSLSRSVFDATAQPVLAERCANPSCHGRPERGLSVFAPHRYRIDPRLTFADDPLTERELDHNFAAAQAWAGAGERPGRSLLLRKPLAEAEGVYHGGGAVFASTDDPGYQALRSWAEGAP